MEITYWEKCGIVEIHLTSFQKGYVRVVFKDILQPSYTEKMKVGCIAIFEIEGNHLLNSFKYDLSR